MAGHKDDGILHAVDSPFCNTSTSIIARQSKSIEDREILSPFTNRQHFGSQDGVEKPVFKLTPLGHEHPFDP